MIYNTGGSYHTPYQTGWICGSDIHFKRASVFFVYDEANAKKCRGVYKCIMSGDYCALCTSQQTLQEILI